MNWRSRNSTGTRKRFGEILSSLNGCIDFAAVSVLIRINSLYLIKNCPLYNVVAVRRNEFGLERDFREAKMANEHWYGLQVRPGFEPLVAQRLRKLNLEVFVPERESAVPREPHPQKNPSGVCVYSRFDLRIRNSIMSIPGVLDIAGTPEPKPCDKEVSGMRRKIFRVL